MSLKEITEREYQFALQVSEMSLYSKDLKGISEMMGKTPKEVRDYYTDIVKAYNQRRYSPKPAQYPKMNVPKEKIKQESGSTPAWEGKTGPSPSKILLISFFSVLILCGVVFAAFEAGKNSREGIQNSRETSQQFQTKKSDGNYVASESSNIYHLLSCDYAKYIKEENKVYFETENEAKESGRRQCEVCFFSERNTPVNKPYNGKIITYTYEECIAPLTVETKGDKDYYIVLKGTDEMSFYVHAGKTAEVYVPLGEYEIYYATGKTWYGREHLFGPETGRYKCNGYFDFYEEDGYVNGWTLELYLQNNGNLHTDKVDEKDFPDI